MVVDGRFRTALYFSFVGLPICTLFACFYELRYETINSGSICPS